MARRSIEIQSFAHQNPIPAGTRIGPLLVSSIIAPFNPGTRDLPDDTMAQLDNLFTHMGQILDGGGATWDDVAKVTFYVKDIAVRDAVNEPWAKHFPHPDSRPSRYTAVSNLPGKLMAQCEFIAWVEA